MVTRGAATGPEENEGPSRVFALTDLPVPIVQAPMAGGPARPELAIAVCRAGGMGFLAAGYAAPARLAEQIAVVRASSAGSFGVNVFVPRTEAADPQAVATYTAQLRPEADLLGVTLPAPRPDDDDQWGEKIDLLVSRPVHAVSFAFGPPPPDVVEALHRVGTFVIATVTSVAEAASVAGSGVDALCVQGPDAGGHRGTFDPAAEPDGTPLPDLLADVGRATPLPLLAAGGLATGDGIAAALRAGATAVQLGTAYLRTPESGAHPAYKAALVDPRYTTTIVTRAFSGRPARGLLNRFVERHHEKAPAAYPEVNQLTRGLRAAAATRGDADGLSLWAGTGYRLATDEPARTVTTRLWRAAQDALA